MLGRWFFLAVVGIGLAVIIHGQRSNASAGTVRLSCATKIVSGQEDLRATIKWNPPAASVADAVSFDLSVSREFIDGTWAGHQVAPDASSFTTEPLASSVRYYFRVNALRGGVWSLVASGSFTAECPAATPQP